MNFLNRCAVRANASGLSDFVLENAIPGFYTPPLCANPSAVDNEEYRYFAISDDGTQHEEGDGIWHADTNTLTRVTVRNSSNGGAKITFSSAPTVYMGGPAAEDMNSSTSETYLHEDGSEALIVETSSGTTESPARISVDTENKITIESTQFRQRQSGGGFTASMSVSQLTDDREINWPDQNGTLAILAVFPVADLPIPDGVPATAFVNDSSVPYNGANIGSVVVGGGSDYSPVYYDLSTLEWKQG